MPSNTLKECHCEVHKELQKSLQANQKATTCLFNYTPVKVVGVPQDTR